MNKLNNRSNLYFLDIERDFLNVTWLEETLKALKFYIEKNFKLDDKVFIPSLFFCLSECGDSLVEELKKYNCPEDLLEFLVFYGIMERDIFYREVGTDLTKINNIFEFPNFMTQEQIDDYISIIRRPCHEYGLRIRKISDREIITYWDKEFNKDIEDYKDILGIDRRILEIDEFKKLIKRRMR
jgi:hypothetical protein